MAKKSPKSNKLADVIHRKVSIHFDLGLYRSAMYKVLLKVTHFSQGHHENKGHYVFRLPTIEKDT
jgi:hypothetical protein